MILEVATLQIKEGQSTNFEAAFSLAKEIIAASPGHISHELQKCVEDKNKYLLLVQWETIEAHEIGFRKSEPYLKWKALLHHFYDPFPTVEHFELIHTSV